MTLPCCIAMCRVEATPSFGVFSPRLVAHVRRLSEFLHRLFATPPNKPPPPPPQRLPSAETILGATRDTKRHQTRHSLAEHEPTVFARLINCHHSFLFVKFVLPNDGMEKT